MAFGKFPNNLFGKRESNKAEKEPTWKEVSLEELRTATEAWKEKGREHKKFPEDYPLVKIEAVVNPMEGAGTYGDPVYGPGEAYTKTGRVRLAMGTGLGQSAVDPTPKAEFDKRTAQEDATEYIIFTYGGQIGASGLTYFVPADSIKKIYLAEEPTSKQ